MNPNSNDIWACHNCMDAYSKFMCCNREWCQRCYETHEMDEHTCSVCGRKQDDTKPCEKCVLEDLADSRLEAMYQ